MKHLAEITMWGGGLHCRGANYVEFLARKAGSLQWIWLLLTNSELSDEEMSSSEFFDDIQLTDTDELEPLFEEDIRSADIKRYTTFAAKTSPRAATCNTRNRAE